MNESAPIFTLSEEIFWAEEIEFKLSPCLPCCQRALLAETGGLVGEVWAGHQPAGSSADSLLLISSFASTSMIQSLGVGTAASPTHPAPKLTLSRPEVYLLESMTAQMCLLVSKYFTFAVKQILLYLKFWC